MTTASATKPRAKRAERVPRRMTDEELTSLMGLLRGCLLYTSDAADE